MVISKMEEPPDENAYKDRKALYDARGAEMDREAQAAHKLINAIIDDKSTPSDNAALARIDSKMESLLSDTRRYLREESTELLQQLEARDFTSMRRTLARTDTLRDEFNEKLLAVRAEMVTTGFGAMATIRSEQTQAVLTSAVVTALAAIVGLTFANLVSGGIIRPVRRLLDGTRAVEEGRLDQSIDVATGDEIGQL